MKKTFTTTALIAAFLLLSNFAANATNPIRNEKAAKESVRQEIIRNISCPDFIDQNSELNQIKAIVQVDTNGKVKVEEINSANPQLKAYVIDQLQSITVKSPGQSQRFVLVINFQVS